MTQMKKPKYTKLIIALVLAGLSWVLLSVFIFVFLKEAFEFLKLFTYLILSAFIGAYAYFLIIRKPFFSSIFFVIAYILSFYALYYNAIHATDKISTYFVIFICFAVLISFSVIDYLLDRNHLQKKQIKAFEKKSK